MYVLMSADHNDFVFDCSNSTVNKYFFKEYLGKTDARFINNDVFSLGDVQFKTFFSDDDVLEDIWLYSYENHTNNVSYSITSLKKFQEFLNNINVVFSIEFSMVSISSRIADSSGFSTFRYLLNNDGVFLDKLDIVSKNEYNKY